MPNFRSLLFAPATRPDRFERALAAGADAVCIDLEDAVGPADKDSARAAAAAFLSARPTQAGPAVGLRVNGTDTAWSADDLALAPHADFLMVPKAASADQLAGVAACTQGVPLWPLVETAEGLMHAWEVAAAPQVQGVLFGAFDYAADVGCAMSWEALLFARGLLAAACARAKVELLDAPSGDIRDLAALAESSGRAKALGFTGRSCIHPDQLGPVHEVFTPTAAELEQARRVLAAFDAGVGGAAQLDGKLIELPVALAARRVLARAGD